jgi:hypothetical protein
MLANMMTMILPHSGFRTFKCKREVQLGEMATLHSSICILLPADRAFSPRIAQPPMMVDGPATQVCCAAKRLARSQMHV